MAGAGTQDASLAFGGENASYSRVTCTEEYDGSSWSAGPALGNVVRNNAGAGTDTSALSFGGYNNTSIIGLTEELSTPALTTNTFESKTDGNLVLANVYLNKNYADDTAAASWRSTFRRFI